MPCGDCVIPGFDIEVTGRTADGGLMLVETKGSHILNGDNTSDKVFVVHKLTVPLDCVSQNRAHELTYLASHSFLNCLGLR